jgi:hypothetical protein
MLIWCSRGSMIVLKLLLLMLLFRAGVLVEGL